MAKNELFDRDIDRTSPEPFYLQLSKAIEDAIDRGEYGPGDKLPSETEFCRSFELARSTVRETLRTLEDRNRVRVVPRRGAYVVDPGRAGWVLQVAAGFFEGEVNQSHRQVETRVLGAEIREFPDVAAEALALREGARGLLLRRLRKLDGKVALYSENYLLAELEPVIRKSPVMRANGSLNQTLAEAGYGIFGARRSVEAVAATPEIAELLERPVGAPVLLVTSVSWGKDGRPFDFYMTWARTDVVKVTVQASAVQS
ncbi:MAG: GntR family transcriptional regulator [Geminicoccaceae bacterium]